jgi:1-acyl-sn-glycerol-3-phosphate acyltransferase
MHRLLPPDPHPRSWPPRLSPAWVRSSRPLRKLARHLVERIHRVEIRGAEHLRAAVAAGHGVLVTPNHCTYSDAYLLYDAADQAGTAAYFMAAWEVFGRSSWLKRYVLQKHGTFTVDRDGADRQAFRTAVEILQAKPEPLIMFPEGEMYHLGDQITPFHEGAAAIAIAAARKGERPIVCLPCGLKYYHLADPTLQLTDLMSRLEASLHWRPRPDLPLVDRIYRLAEGALALKEIEYAGAVTAGPLPERLAALADHVLRRLEGRHQLPDAGHVTERVKRIRRQVLGQLAEGDLSPDQESALKRDLNDVFLVVQLFCYPGDYVSRQPTLERISETLDKLEEDVLGVPLARPRVPRGAIVALGEPIVVNTAAARKEGAGALTERLEERVQALLDSIRRPRPLSPSDPPTVEIPS